MVSKNIDLTEDAVFSSEWGTMQKKLNSFRNALNRHFRKTDRIFAQFIKPTKQTGLFATGAKYEILEKTNYYLERPFCEGCGAPRKVDFFRRMLKKHTLCQKCEYKYLGIDEIEDPWWFKRIYKIKLREK